MHVTIIRMRSGSVITFRINSRWWQRTSFLRTPRVHWRCASAPPASAHIHTEHVNVPFIFLPGHVTYRNGNVQCGIRSGINFIEEISPDRGNGKNDKHLDTANTPITNSAEADGKKNIKSFSRFSMLVLVHHSTFSWVLLPVLDWSPGHGKNLLPYSTCGNCSKSENAHKNMKRKKKKLNKLLSCFYRIFPNLRSPFLSAHSFFFFLLCVGA